jgi:hypothetical protein
MSTEARCWWGEWVGRHPEGPRFHQRPKGCAAEFRGRGRPRHITTSYNFWFGHPTEWKSWLTRSSR